MQIPLVKSPLGIIALFVALIEAFLSFPVTQLVGAERMIIVLFMTSFPFFIGMGFFYILWHKPINLYNPEEIPTGLQDRYQPEVKQQIAAGIAAEIKLKETTESIRSTKTVSSAENAFGSAGIGFGMSEDENLAKEVVSEDLKSLESKALDKLSSTTNPNQLTIRELKRQLQVERKQDKERTVSVVKEVISEFKEYLHGVGFTDLPEVEKIIVEPKDYPNMYYAIEADELHLGQSLETDHGLICNTYLTPYFEKHWAYPKTREEGEQEAIITGLRDYYSCSYYDNPCVGPKLVLVARKAGIKLKSDCVRNLKEYVELKNVSNEHHDKSRVWSSALWELREKYGKVKTDSAIYLCITLLPKKLTFRNSATILIAEMVKKTSDKSKFEIQEVFIRRGIDIPEVKIVPP